MSVAVILLAWTLVSVTTALLVGPWLGRTQPAPVRVRCARLGDPAARR